MLIRPEHADDADAIHTVTRAAFESAPHASGTEAAIVDALRAADALTLSLVAEEQGRIVGHAAFSSVLIDGSDRGGFGLGPVSVLPAMQRRGIGAALVREGLDRLAEAGARSCVVLGNPAYYGRFGFTVDPELRYGDVPPGYMQSLTFIGEPPRGEVAYHRAFDAG